MFTCSVCSIPFTRSSSLLRHTKLHIGSKFSCSVCSEVFTLRHSLIRHSKEKHYTSNKQKPTTPKQEIRELLMRAESIYDHDMSSSSAHVIKRTHHVENSTAAVNAKKTRMCIVKTPGFVKTGSSPSNKIEWYYKKNLDNTTNYRTFLNSAKNHISSIISIFQTNS